LITSPTTLYYINGCHGNPFEAIASRVMWSPTDRKPQDYGSERD